MTTAYGGNIVGSVWKEKGFEDFADGTFGNGGQNLYVSRKGVLQRIFRFDVDQDGYADVLFVNSQDMGERPPVYVYPNPFRPEERLELPSAGSYYGAIGDLNGDGYDDLVVANQHNGTHADVTAYIYYGSPEGLSERYKTELPVPNCRAVAIGDFNGDGLPDIAFASGGKLVVYYQTANGFRHTDSVTMDMELTHMAAGDIDRDGFADLYVRAKNRPPLVLWGGPEGLQLSACVQIGGDDPGSLQLASTTAGWMTFVEGWAPKIVELGGKPFLFRQENDAAAFYPCGSDRAIGEPLVLGCRNVVSAGAADLNGDGYGEIVLAVCADRDANELSWIYWGGAAGFGDDRRTALQTISARDVSIGDLDGDGVPEIVICQGRTDVMNTTESLIYRVPGQAEWAEAAGDAALLADPIRLVTHDAATALIGRTSDAEHPQIIFINHVSGRVRGDVSAYAYLGGSNGFDADRRIEFPGWAAVDSICCDFNDNGWGDVFIANCAENAPHLDPGSFLYWGGPEGFDPDRKQILPTLRAHGSAVGDYRHSGYLDLAVVGVSNPELLIFRGGPDGFDTANPQRILMDPNMEEYIPVKALHPYEDPVGIAYREPRWMLAADFNNDGWLDLFVSQIFGYSYILWGGPEGYSMERSTRLNCDGGICAQAADLTGNGWLDLIVGGHLVMGKNAKYESYIYIYWGGPEGYREERRAQLPAHTANALTIADFNRDGILDIFATSYNSGRERDIDAYLYWGQPGGHFSAENRLQLPAHSSCGAMAIDFDEDGWVDLAIANHKTYGDHVGHSYVMWNGPEGFSPQRMTKLPTLGPHGMMSVDPGNIADRGAEEFYISSAHELPEGEKVTRMVWEAELQPKTWVKAQLRFAAYREELEHAAWQGPDGTVEAWFDNGQGAPGLRQTGRWVQYRLALGAVNGGNSPRVTEVRVESE
ncbi:FG-GAP repeat domain-containing protein [Paenibacillus sp. MBLB4367]|uniref:FG-GAP repeat domain-containing protein n=1 Tax=Paenibacillus sp. MBLB4367 TaxID=3384767 RepID=UPI003908290B